MTLESPLIRLLLISEGGSRVQAGQGIGRKGSMEHPICPLCKTNEHVILLAVNFGEQLGYESVNLCTHCHSVFGFKPLEAAGDVTEIKKMVDRYVSA